MIRSMIIACFILFSMLLGAMFTLALGGCGAAPEPEPVSTERVEADAGVPVAMPDAAPTPNPKLGFPCAFEGRLLNSLALQCARLGGVCQSMLGADSSEAEVVAALVCL